MRTLYNAFLIMEDYRSMISHGKEIAVFTGNSNPALAKDICSSLFISPGNCSISAFADGECSVSVYEPVRGKDVFIVQSTCKPVNDSLMELLILIDAMRRASAGRITAVIPYFGYARQDRKAKSRDPISAKLVANLITKFSGGAPSGVTGNAPREQTLFLFPNGMLGIINKKAKAGDWIHYSITDWDETAWGWSVRKEMERGCHRIGYKAYIYASTETSQMYIDRAETMMKDLGIKDYTITRDIPIHHKTDQEWREWARKQKQTHPQYDWQMSVNASGCEYHTAPV